MPILPRSTAAMLAMTVGLEIGVATAANAELAPAAQASALQLRERHAAASPALQRSPFGRPLLLDSADEDGQLSGEVLAVLDLPFADLRDTLEEPRAWCEVLMLTPNVPGCRVERDGGVQLELSLARRFEKLASQTSHHATVDYRVTANAGDYLALHLTVEKGPLGTRDYRLGLEALALDAQRSVLRLRYAYRYGLRARLAGKVYLATLGSGKLGFTQLPDGTPEEPHYVDGMRGSVERNVMRYYLAIEARTSQAAIIPAQLRFARSLDFWLAAIANHPLQLAEPDPEAYRSAKLAQFDEILRGEVPVSGER